MADDAYKPERTADYEASRGCAVRLGEQLIQTAQGPVRMADAPGITTMLVSHAKDPEWSSVGVLVYDPDATIGMVCQLDATAARTIAASLLRLAAELDTGKPN